MVATSLSRPAVAPAWSQALLQALPAAEGVLAPVQQRGRQLVAVAVRQAQVKQDHVRCTVAERLSRLLKPLRLFDVVAMAHQAASDRRDDERIVVNDKDARAAVRHDGILQSGGDTVRTAHCGVPTQAEAHRERIWGTREANP